MLVNNINYLSEKYPYIKKQLKEVQESEVQKFFIEETRKGDKTLYYENNEKKSYFHSKYDPTREAESLIEKYKEIKDKSIIFYGTGLGYHIDLLMIENSDNDYYIFEPIPELLEQFLSFRDLTENQYKKLKRISVDIKDISLVIDSIMKSDRKDLQVIEVPTHKQIFEKEFKELSDTFVKTVKQEKSNLLTVHGFQQRWIINSMTNFKEVLNTPNILMQKKDKFINKPAILVSAGPSLDEEIENLKYIKENGLAYIFAVGSSIRTLVQHKIYPDAVTTYDPKVTNHGVLNPVRNQKITEIPLIFGSSVGQKTLLNYPGDMYHMITSQDSISDYFLETENKEEIIKIQDAPSIALITLQLLYKMGFSNILLVGQNLAYIGKKQYSEGVTYRKDLTDTELRKGISIKDVYGNDILSSEDFNTMREQMEDYIEKMTSVQIINTTKGGASIKGTIFKDLEYLIDNDLKDKVVEKDWLNGNEFKYNKKYLEFKLNEMNKAYKRALKVNKEYYEILNSIDRLLERKNFSQIEKLYIKLDKEFSKIENNDYYKYLILPMNRVQYKILVDSIDSLNDIKDAYERGKRIVEVFKRFMNKCGEDIKEIEPIYEEMMGNIKKHIEN